MGLLLASGAAASGLGTRRAAMAIQHGQVAGSGALTNFPVLLTQANFPTNAIDADHVDRMQSNGGDLRFSTDIDGFNQLACEVVSVALNNDPTSSRLEVWVLLPSVAGTVDTTFYAWWTAGGAAGLTQPAVGAAFGRNAVWADYLAVYHGDTLTDATGNGNTLTATNAYASAGASAGRVGSALQCGTSSANRGFFSGGSAAMLDNKTSYTISVWHKTLSTALDEFYFPWAKSNPDGSDVPPYMYCWRGDLGGGIYAYNAGFNETGGNYAHTSPTGQAGTSNWTHSVATYAGPSVAYGMRVYCDGWLRAGDFTAITSLAEPPTTAAGTSDTNGGAQNDAAWDMTWGGGPTWGGSAVHYGLLDECRITTLVRSQAWIATEYANQNDPAAFVVEGAIVEVGGASSVTLLPSLLSNPNTFFGAVVSASVTVAPNLLTDGDTFFPATISTAYTLAPPVISNANTFFAPTISVGAVTLAPSLLTDGDTFFASTITVGGVTLAPPLLTNTTTFFAPTVSIAGSNFTLQPPLLASTSQVFAPTVTAAVTLSPTFFSNANTFFSATISTALTLVPALLSNSNTFFAPTVSALTTLQPGLLSDGDTFFAAAVSAAATLTPPLVQSSTTFFSAVITTGPVTLSAPLIPSASVVFEPAVVSTVTVAPPLLVDADTFFPASLSSGPAILRPELLVNVSVFFAPAVQDVTPTLFLKAQQGGVVDLNARRVVTLRGQATHDVVVEYRARRRA